MTSINPIYNVNYTQTTAFKHKNTVETEPATTNPISQPNTAFKGTEALRAYNYNLINKENFNIPELKPICPLEDMDKIKGERIYNSDGELVCIIDENKDYKIIYTPSSENKDIYDVEVFKDNELIKRQTFYKSVDGNRYLAIFDEKNNCNTGYKYNCGNLTLHHKEKEYKDNTYMFLAEKQEYECYDGDIKKIYDKNLKLKQAIDFSQDDKNTRTNYWNNNPISSETRTYENLNLKEESLNPFEDKDLIPAKFYEIEDTDNIQGKKFYYSNGKLEKIITPENKTYHYDLDGNFEYLEFDNKEILFGGNNSIEIKEKLNNNSTKTTYFDGKQPSFVEFKNGEKSKNITYFKDNTICYQQCDDGYSVLQKTYDENKNLINKTVWYHDDNDY